MEASLDAKVEMECHVYIPSLAKLQVKILNMLNNNTKNTMSCLIIVLNF